MQVYPLEVTNKSIISEIMSKIILGFMKVHVKGQNTKKKRESGSGILKGETLLKCLLSKSFCMLICLCLHFFLFHSFSQSVVSF